MAQAIWLGFTNWNGFNPPKFVGLANFREIAHDPLFRIAIEHNFLIAAAFPIWVALPLVAAILIHGRVFGWRFFRFAFFLPIVLSPVLIGMYFKLVLGYSGPLNVMLRGLGLGVLRNEWLASPQTVLPVVIAILIWSTFGIGVMIFLAALANVDPDLQDAARVDGASELRVHLDVTLPQIRPTIEFWTVIVMITAFTSVFGIIYTLTSGGPGYSSQVMEYNIYQQAFLSNRFGYASALGVVLLTIALVLVVAQMLFFRRAWGKAD